MGGLVEGWIDGIRRRARGPDKKEEVVDVVLSRRTWKRPENFSSQLELKQSATGYEEGAQLSIQDVRCRRTSSSARPKI